MGAKTKTTRSRTKWFDSLFGIETALKKATLQLYGFHRMAEIVTSLIDLYAHIYIHGKIYFVIWKDDFKILRSLEEVDFVHQCKCIKINNIGVQFHHASVSTHLLFRRPLTAAILHSPGLYALKGLSLECFVLCSSL